MVYVYVCINLSLYVERYLTVNVRLCNMNRSNKEYIIDLPPIYMHLHPDITHDMLPFWHHDILLLIQMIVEDPRINLHNNLIYLKMI